MYYFTSFKPLSAEQASALSIEVERAIEWERSLSEAQKAKLVDDTAVNLMMRGIFTDD